MAYTVNEDAEHGGAHLSDKDFRRLSEWIHANIGVCMGPEKKTLMEGRVKKRMRHLKIPTFQKYCEFVFSLRGNGEEAPFLIDVVTTNKTDFFREPAHFEYLNRTALPSLAGRNLSGSRSTFHVWSAACSSGEEPYTLAMVLQEYIEANAGWDYTILATDISGTVLEKAGQAVYQDETIQAIPFHLRKKYLLKSRDPRNPVVRIVPELREKVQLRRLNLIADAFDITGELDVIFCRNVMIYFDRPTQEKLIKKFYDHLSPGGYLFIGHAESLSNLKTPFIYMAPTIYMKDGYKDA
ncbi:MAG: protein-glutamate O-methyltransferase [Syntrophales bacterium]